MEFSTNDAFNATEEIADSINYPDLRLYTIKDTASDVPLYDGVSKARPVQSAIVLRSSLYGLCSWVAGFWFSTSGAPVVVLWTSGAPVVVLRPSVLCSLV